MAERNNRRVLVVDDAGLVRRYYREILESAGYEVEEALNGLEAMERLLTAYQEDLDQGTNPPTHGYNPTFDLWCTGGYSSKSKAYPTDLSTASAQATLWTKNW